MKSMLHEASSVVQAVKQAWEKSGKPSEFTIKVLDHGKRSFWFFTDRPAIVSITYETTRPVGQSYNQQKSKYPNAGKPARGQRETPQQNANQAVAGKQPRQRVRLSDRADQADRPERQDRHERPERPQRHERTEREEKSERIERTGAAVTDEPEVWTEEFVSYVKTCWQEIAVPVAKSHSIKTEINGFMLNIVTSNHLIDDRDLEKNLCHSLSYLILQFVKKKFKKKLRNFRLSVIIHGSKQSESNDQSE